MGEWYAAVEKKLGSAVLEVIMEEVRKREISMVQMESLAENLGGKVWHWQRKDEGAENNEEEMKAILGDWEAYGDLKELRRLDGIQKLAELLRSSTAGKSALADRLSRYASRAGEDVDRVLMQGIIKPDDPGIPMYWVLTLKPIGQKCSRLCGEPGLRSERRLWKRVQNLAVRGQEPELWIQKQGVTKRV